MIYVKLPFIVEWGDKPQGNGHLLKPSTHGNGQEFEAESFKNMLGAHVIGMRSLEKPYFAFCLEPYPENHFLPAHLKRENK